MTPSRPAGGVLRDLDGTLIDSAEQHYVAWRDALARRGRGHAREEFFRGFGRRNDVILREIFGDGLSPEEAARVADDKEERYRRLVRENGLEPLPVVTEWLTRLEEGGRPGRSSSCSDGSPPPGRGWSGRGAPEPGGPPGQPGTPFALRLGRRSRS